MLVAQSHGYSYCRLLTDNANESLTKDLKEKFDYSFVVSYGEFSDGEYEMLDKNSAVISLKEGLDAAFSNFRSTNRNEVRRSYKIEGLEFHHEVDDMTQFYEFYAECERDRGWHPEPFEELNNSKIIYASYKGLPISGMSAYTHGNFIRIGRIFSLRRSAVDMEQPNLVYGSAAKRIIYEFCEQSIAQGFSSLDLGGVDLNSNLKSGITGFKLSFGAEVVPVKLGRYSKVGYKKIQQELAEDGLDLT